MIQDDVEALCAFQSAVYAVEDLVGNHGKRVLRVIERYFPAGVFDLALPGSVELTHFQFACYLATVAEGCEMANDYASAVEEEVLAAQGARMRFRSEVVDVGRRSYRIIIEPEHIPQTMRGRQVFLRTANQGVDRVLSMIDMRNVLAQEELEDSFFVRLFSDDPSLDTEGARDCVKEQFDALLRQDYHGISVLPVALVDLAALIAPEVSEALRSAVERTALRKTG